MIRKTVVKVMMLAVLVSSLTLPGISDAAPVASSWGWGADGGGAVGTGTTTLKRPSPRLTRGLKGVTQLSAGGNFSLGLLSDGTVWSWGSNAVGNLGSGTGASRAAPGRLVGITGIKTVEAGGSHAFALSEDGRLWGWGSNVVGSVGIGGAGDYVLSPTLLNALTNVATVSAGTDHSLASKTDGSVWAWGSNLEGRLGDGSTLDRELPVAVTGVSDIRSVSAGLNHSLALSSDGTVWGWGNNLAGQLGDGSTTQRLTPVKTQGISDVTEISAGAGFSLALSADGTVWSWGSNFHGKLGDGTTINRSLPAQVPGLTEVISVSAGWNHALAVRSDGTIFAWGGNFYGQLGDGTDTDRWSPTRVLQIWGPPSATSVSAGDDHSLAIGPGWDHRYHLDQDVESKSLKIDGKNFLADPSSYEVTISMDGAPVYQTTLPMGGVLPNVSQQVSSPSHITVLTISDPFRKLCLVYLGSTCAASSPLLPHEAVDWLNGEGQSSVLVIEVVSQSGVRTVALPYAGHSMSMVPEL